MFAVDDILISDDVLDAPFSCNLGLCHGACCVIGAGGAPLLEDELPELERAFSVVRQSLRPEAMETIEKQGVWTEEAPGEWATSCVGNAECVFVVYDGPIAKCSIQQAYFAGRLDFEKPMSCHLFPIRIEKWADTTVINYEQIDLCRPAVKTGQRQGVQLADFLERPLTRRFGATWYRKFRTACRERAETLASIQK